MRTMLGFLSMGFLLCLVAAVREVWLQLEPAQDGRRVAVLVADGAPFPRANEVLVPHVVVWRDLQEAEDLVDDRAGLPAEVLIADRDVRRLRQQAHVVDEVAGGAHHLPPDQPYAQAEARREQQPGERAAQR